MNPDKAAILYTSRSFSSAIPHGLTAGHSTIRLLALFFLVAGLLLSLQSAAFADNGDCVTFGEIPTPGSSQWSSVEEMCEASTQLPEVPSDLVPPADLDTLDEKDAYSAKVVQFLADRKYHEWIGDAHWRFTGDVAGCPAEGILSFGTHNLVRVWYSPSVIKWLCNDRKGALPDGAMIVKEEHLINSASKVITDPNTFDPKTGTYLMGAPQDLSNAPIVVPMIKRRSASFDGWWMGGIGVYSTGNPPLKGPSAFVGNPPENPAEPSLDWYPTGLNQVQPNVAYPNVGIGQYCINCHGMAESESTFSAIENIMGNELVYKWRGKTDVPSGCQGDGSSHLDLPGDKCPNPFPAPLAKPNDEFVDTFPELSPPSFQHVWNHRFPAESYDRVVSGAEGPDQFLTSDQCVGCHEAVQNNNGQPWNMILVPEDGGDTQFNLSPDAEWRWSPMGLGGRDPVFLAQLESELNQADREKKLAPKKDCVENLCLGCHGSAGQRQLALDTAGQGPLMNSVCNPLLPEAMRGDPSELGPELFTRHLMALWDGSPDYNPDYFKYGALGREGISCTICHHSTDEGLDTFESFTGNLEFGPADIIYGPFSKPKQVSMKQALGITPVEAPWIKESGLCGSCHAIYLPVLDNEGEVLDFAFEQTTYLEWLNSDFAKDSKSRASATGPKTCQDCHMPNTFHRDGETTNLAFKIANIEDDTLPPYPYLLPQEDITLPVRKNFARHVLYGLNVPLNAYAQQFPLLMGVRQLDFWSPGSQVAVPLLVARDTVLQIAGQDTADITIRSLSRTPNGLAATVLVKNKTGHFFPSGVSFRRAFIEFRVLDAEGSTLWASGSTNSAGVILDGETGEPLDTEFFVPKTPGGQAKFQEHHTTITRQSQVQIYEELYKDSSGSFTTSFLHRVETVKDNRLRAMGWRRTGPYAEETKPEGRSRLDRDYLMSPNKGIDKIVYQVTLPKEQRKKIHSVEVRLLYQSTPPYYLRQRFASANAGPLSEDTNRLFYMASHLSTDAPGRDGEPYLEDWKIQIGTTQTREVPWTFVRHGSAKHEAVRPQ